MADLDAFLAGDRPDHVALFLSDSFVDDEDALAEHGERVDGGIALVVEGDRGRRVFQAATGLDAMSFAREAGQHPATVAADLSGGECPDAADPDATTESTGSTDSDDPNAATDPDRPAGQQGHGVRFVFAFAEAQNEGAGGIYAEGDVIHAYAACECGQPYSEKWVMDEA